MVLGREVREREGDKEGREGGWVGRKERGKNETNGKDKMKGRKGRKEKENQESKKQWREGKEGGGNERENEG